MVGRDQVPWGPFGAAELQHILIGGHVPFPVSSFLKVCWGEFPTLGRIFESLLEAFQLFSWAYVKVELQNLHVILGQDLFEAVDFLIPS